MQARNTLRATTAAPGPSAAHHDMLNAGSNKLCPGTWSRLHCRLILTWVTAITLDAAIAAAQGEGIGERFFVGVPSGPDGVWTIAQTGLNDDINDPTRELTVHVDQHTRTVVGRGGWNEYPPLARAVAAGSRFTWVRSDGGTSSARAWCVCRSSR